MKGIVQEMEIPLNIRHLAPKKYARARPRHGNIPAAYISMIGVDEKYSSNGYGGELLVDALTRIASAADRVGIALVMLDVFDCGDPDKTERRKQLYINYGFQPLTSDALRLYMPIEIARKMLTEK